MIQSIIIADDSATARMFIKRCLEMAGYQDAAFYEAKDGYDVLELVKEQSVDLLITDLNMPHMDGKSLLKRIKTNPRYCDLPVLVITSADNPATEQELRKFGAFAILGKPVSPDILASTLQGLSEETSWGI